MGTPTCSGSPNYTQPSSLGSTQSVSGNVCSNGGLNIPSTALCRTRTTASGDHGVGKFSISACACVKCMLGMGRSAYAHTLRSTWPGADATSMASFNPCMFFERETGPTQILTTRRACRLSECQHLQLPVHRHQHDRLHWVFDRDCQCEWPVQHAELPRERLECQHRRLQLCRSASCPA